MTVLPQNSCTPKEADETAERAEEAVLGADDTEDSAPTVQAQLAVHVLPAGQAYPISQPSPGSMMPLAQIAATETDETAEEGLEEESTMIDVELEREEEEEGATTLDDVEEL